MTTIVTARSGPGGRYAAGVGALGGIVLAVGGGWSLLAPGSFAEFVRFPYHEHFLHDLGAFQLGLGTVLLLALAWSDALATALAGFVVADTVHVVNHGVDMELGGSAAQTGMLGALAVLAVSALAVRLRALGWVVGAVGAASTPELAPFVRQKTVLLTTYRRNGTPGSTPVSLAVDGDHAYLRCPANALKARRLSRDPRVQVARSTGRGHVRGAPVAGYVRLLDGVEAQLAARVLAAKHPLLQGVLVPLVHRLFRAKTGRTLHYELRLGPHPAPPASPTTSGTTAVTTVDGADR